MKFLISSFVALGLLSSPALAALIVDYNFENYTPGTNEAFGNTADDIVLDGGDNSFMDRIYDRNNTLPTGITSTSPITFTVNDVTGGQNKVENHVSSNRFRWRMHNSGPVTATFTIDIDPGYTLKDFTMSFDWYTNTNGDFSVTYNDDGGGPVAMGGYGSGGGESLNVGDSPQSFTSNVISTAVTGSVEFVLTVNSTTGTQTSRWDDIQINGTLEAIPEPSSLALLMSALLGGACLRRR